MTSPAIQLAERLATLGPAAHAELDRILDGLSVVEQAALAYDWLNFWARRNQIIPPGGRWRSHGFLTARRVGKTRSLAEHVVGEAASGRAMRIGFMAQNEDKTLEVMVQGDAGLMACSPPWFAARYESSGKVARVVWPNGAQAFPFTPETPGAIRGPGVHLFWASELQSWPVTKRDEAWFNAQLMTSLGYARTLWDATPKRRHPIIRKLLDRARAEPDIHTVVRGTIHDNRDNLGAGVIEDLEKAMAGTQRGREELLGEYSDDDDEALWSQEWIDAHRRDMPRLLRRRVLSLDPAITDTKGSDRTGYTDQGLGEDDQLYVFADLTRAGMSWDEWGQDVVERYFVVGADCIVVETDRGGDGIASNIRVHAREYGRRHGRTITTEVVDLKATTRHNPHVIYVKEIHHRSRSKAARAEPVASMYKQGRVSHIRGVDFASLEDTMCTWEPEEGGRSPDDLDALVHGLRELGGLSFDQEDPAIGFTGITEAARVLAAPPAAQPVDQIITGRTASAIMAALGGGWEERL